MGGDAHTARWACLDVLQVIGFVQKYFFTQRHLEEVDTAQHPM